MPVIVACPSCGGKLRIADALLGGRVRCPACNATFDSTNTPSEPPPPPPPPAGLDLPLQLSLDAPSSAPAPSANGPRGLVGAVELPSSPADKAAAPPRSPAPPPSASPPRPSPPLDEHNDQKECPVCGKFLHRDSIRCYNCGERFGEGRRRWDESDFRRSAPRRDTVPDRGAIVLALGIISLSLVMTWCAAPLGVILGLVSWVMGQSDLRRIKNGEMDPGGRGMTQAGWICGIIGTILNLLVTLGCGLFFGVIWYSEMSRLPNTSRIPASRTVRPAPLNKPPMKQP